VADVLFRAPSGKIAFDFSGTLTFDWPRTTAANAVANAAAKAATETAQFPYGYGLNYRVKR
jgi:hypothetical protein